MSIIQTYTERTTFNRDTKKKKESSKHRHLAFTLLKHGVTSTCPHHVKQDLSPASLSPFEAGHNVHGLLPQPADEERRSKCLGTRQLAGLAFGCSGGGAAE